MVIYRIGKHVFLFVCFLLIPLLCDKFILFHVRVCKDISLSRSVYQKIVFITFPYTAYRLLCAVLDDVAFETGITGALAHLSQQYTLRSKTFRHGNTFMHIIIIALCVNTLSISHYALTHYHHRIMRKQTFNKSCQCKNDKPTVVVKMILVEGGVVRVEGYQKFRKTTCCSNTGHQQSTPFVWPCVHKLNSLRPSFSNRFKQAILFSKTEIGGFLQSFNTFLTYDVSSKRNRIKRRYMNNKHIKSN